MFKAALVRLRGDGSGQRRLYVRKGIVAARRGLLRLRLLRRGVAQAERTEHVSLLQQKLLLHHVLLRGLAHRRGGGLRLHLQQLL